MVTKEDKIKFGNNFREYRKKLGWTQREMSKFLGIGDHNADISRYERGASLPSGKIMLLISKYFGLDQFVDNEK